MSLLGLWNQATEYSPDDPRRTRIHADICVRGGLRDVISSREPAALEILAGALVDGGGDWAQALYSAFSVMAPAVQQYHSLRSSNRKNAEQPRGKEKRRAIALKLYQERIAQGISPAAARRQITRQMKIAARTLRDYLSPL